MTSDDKKYIELVLSNLYNELQVGSVSWKHDIHLNGRRLEQLYGRVAAGELVLKFGTGRALNRILGFKGKAILDVARGERALVDFEAQLLVGFRRQLAIRYRDDVRKYARYRDKPLRAQRGAAPRTQQPGQTRQRVTRTADDAKKAAAIVKQKPIKVVITLNSWLGL